MNFKKTLNQSFEKMIGDDCMDLIHKYVYKMEHKEKMERLNQEFNKIGITKLKMNLQNICEDEYNPVIYYMEYEIKQWKATIIIKEPIYYPYDGKSINNI